jgi:hypothetical protein
MTDETKEPIDLLKRRAEKLLKEESRKAQEKGTQKQLEWPGAKFRDEAKSIQLSEELLDRVKIMMRVIASNVKEAGSIHDVERSCFGLALILLKDHDHEAYERLLALVREIDEDG